MAIEYKIRDTLYKGYSSRRKPVYRTISRDAECTFTIDNVQFELYPIHVLAEALDRKKRAIIAWENDGRFPKPMYDYPRSHYTKKDGTVIKPRWYTGVQILNLHNLWFNKYGNMERFPKEHLDQFLQECKVLFYKRELENKT